MKTIADPEILLEYWKNNTWFPPEYEENNFEIDRLSKMIIFFLNSQNIKNPKIIEFCCGKGDFTLKFLSNYKKDIKSYHCIDINRNSLDLLVSNLKCYTKVRVETIHDHVGGDDLIFKLPNDADVIICS